MKFAGLFERKPLPTLPTRENGSRKAGSIDCVGSSDSSDSSDLKTAHESLKADAAAGGACPQLPDKPKLCPMCGNWRQRKGYAYWCGTCASSGREINFQSRCNLGMTELPRGRV